MMGSYNSALMFSVNITQSERLWACYTTFELQKEENKVGHSFLPDS